MNRRPTRSTLPDTLLPSATPCPPYAAQREPARCGPVRFRPASGAGTREGVMRCPYHGPRTTRSRDRAIPAPPHPFGLRLPLLLLVLLSLAACVSTPPPAAPAPAPLVLVSIDGFRADYLDAGLAPNLVRIAGEGVHAQWMNPSYPSLTFPNHYTIVTGLRPDHHGIVHNTMRDAGLGRFKLSDRDAVGDGRWWGGEPIWITAQKEGDRKSTRLNSSH